MALNCLQFIRLIHFLENIFHLNNFQKACCNLTSDLWESFKSVATIVSHGAFKNTQIKGFKHGAQKLEGERERVIFMQINEEFTHIFLMATQFSFPC